MDVDTKDASDASNDSSSGPEEIANNDAKEMAVATIKAEFASQRSLQEKAKKLRIQIELRNIEQKKIKEEKNEAEYGSSPPKSVKSEIDDKTVSPGVEETKSEKPEKKMKSKKNKKPKKLGNSNDKRDSSAGKSQTDSESYPTFECKPDNTRKRLNTLSSSGKVNKNKLVENDGSKIIRDSSAGNSQTDSKNDPTFECKPKKLSGAARKKARKRLNALSSSGKVNKNNIVENDGSKTRASRRFRKFKAKAKTPKNNIVANNNSTEKTHGKKRKFKETKNDTPKIESMKRVKVKTEQTAKVKTEQTVKVKTEQTVKVKTEKAD